MTEQPATGRTVVFVAGAGRSGTSTLAGVLQILGFAVPGPEVEADHTNPKGFGEPRWAVDFHERLLREVHVAVSDARPEAWELCAAHGALPEVSRPAQEWLASHPGELVIKDPRLAWFLPMWREAASATGAQAKVVTMLRPPAEVVGSKTKYYGGRLGAAHLAASWVNMLLHVEHLTRDVPRAFVPYADLLTDAPTAVTRMGDQLGVAAASAPSSDQAAQIAAFIDPSLRRVEVRLEDLELPRALADLTQATWDALSELSQDDSPSRHEELDRLRAEYAQLYAEAEAISKSTWEAARERTRVEVRRRVTQELAAARPSLWRRVVRALRS